MSESNGIVTPESFLPQVFEQYPEFIAKEIAYAVESEKIPDDQNLLDEAQRFYEQMWEASGADYYRSGF